MRAPFRPPGSRSLVRSASAPALPRLARVASSRSSIPSIPSIPPSMPARSAAASATVRAIGPGVSCVCEMGTMPARLSRPTVGLIPTRPQAAAGETIEPSVSVPTAAAARLAAAAAPEPELEPDGERSSA